MDELRSSYMIDPFILERNLFGNRVSTGSTRHCITIQRELRLDADHCVGGGDLSGEGLGKLGDRIASEGGWRR